MSQHFFSRTRAGEISRTTDQGNWCDGHDLSTYGNDQRFEANKISPRNSARAYFMIHEVTSSPVSKH